MKEIVHQVRIFVLEEAQSIIVPLFPVVSYRVIRFAGPKKFAYVRRIQFELTLYAAQFPQHDPWPKDARVLAALESLKQQYSVLVWQELH